MMKMLTCLGCATLSVVALTACGTTAPITIDKANLWTNGNTAQVSTKGYWWTYTDHNLSNGTANAGASIVPITSKTTGLPIVPDPDVPAERPHTIHASGYTPAAPDWTTVNTPAWTDGYWVGKYPNSTDATGNVVTGTINDIKAYPAAGIGFGFQENNKPYDVTQGTFVGFTFDMKTKSNTGDIFVSMPVVGTDVPDTFYTDAFEFHCAFPAAPFSTGHLTQTCFGNYHKAFKVTLNTVATATTPADTPDMQRAADGAWQTYCVLWTELTIPSWVNAGPTATAPAATPIVWNASALKNALKVQWDMFQPVSGGNSNFDVYLDRVRMITAKDAADASNHCNPANIPTSATLAGVPAQ